MLLPQCMQLQTVDDKIASFISKKFRTSRSFSTMKTYQTALNKFTEFLRVQYNLELDHLLRMIHLKEKDPITVLDDFYSFLSNYQRPSRTGYSNRTIHLYVVAVKEFLRSCGCRIYNEDIKQQFRLPKKNRIDEDGLTREILVRLLHNSPAKLQTAVLMTTSSGMRIGELVQLKTSDIDFTIPTTIHVRAETTKTREARIVHISNEATNSLKDYLVRTFGWTKDENTDRFIFLQTYEERLGKLRALLERSKDEEKPGIKKRIDELEKEYSGLNAEQKFNKAVLSAKNVLEMMLRDIIKKVPELSIRSANGRYLVHFHACRSYFKTQVTDAHESDYAEAMMGHSSIKLTYYRQNAKARAETYLKVEPHLVISDFSQVQKNIESLEQRLKEAEIQLAMAKQYQETRQNFKQ